MAVFLHGDTQTKETIAQLRHLVEELASRTARQACFEERFQFFELPELVSSIVDFLQPRLKPNEAAVYWYLFRHSILVTGDSLIRITIADLCDQVLDRSSPLSAAALGEALIGLVTKGALVLAGDADGSGTAYRVRLPDEIPACREEMVRRQAPAPHAGPQTELDFYRIRENRLKIFERDRYLCHVCQKPLTRFNATLDYLRPPAQGGDSSDENLVTVCWEHSSLRPNAKSAPASSAATAGPSSVIPAPGGMAEAKPSAAPMPAFEERTTPEEHPSPEAAEDDDERAPVRPQSSSSRAKPNANETAQSRAGFTRTSEHAALVPRHEPVRPAETGSRDESEAGWGKLKSWFRKSFAANEEKPQRMAAPVQSTSPAAAKPRSAHAAPSMPKSDRPGGQIIIKETKKVVRRRSRRHHTDD